MIDCPSFALKFIGKARAECGAANRFAEGKLTTPNPAIAISAMTTTSALGAGTPALRAALTAERSALKPTPVVQGAQPPGHVGQVAELDTTTLPADLQPWDCRNNRLAWLALQQDGFLQQAQRAVARYGASRVAVFLGTSTSGIACTEMAYAESARESQLSKLPAWYDYPHTHNIHSVSAFVAQVTGASGPTHTISTACSSSAKVFATASRALRAGLCDAAIVGGVDTLCLTTLFGFHALQLVSPEPCRPADADRSGISIGEAGGFALLEPAGDPTCGWLLGAGESSDAYHMSSPDPAGRGAMAAMQQALTRAGKEASEVDYVNLHGTGTWVNDAAEDTAVSGLLGTDTPCSSTKGWTGHTLGAAGITEAVICLLCLQDDFLPRSLNTRTLDPDLRANILMHSGNRPLRTALSNSFGFGGTNCSLLLGAAR